MRLPAFDHSSDRKASPAKTPHKISRAGAHSLVMKQTSFRVRPAVRRAGGKGRLLSSILPRIAEHTCYCEPFAGGLAVLLVNPISEQVKGWNCPIKSQLPFVFR